MKRIITALCALALFAAGATPVLAAETSLPNCYYPISVEEYTYGPFDELRVNKVYQLSLSDDPGLIPTDDFERSGRRYYLLDMTRQDAVGVDIRAHTETVTLASDTDQMDGILQRLDAEMEVTTEDGYTGALRLDHTSVQVTVDGYASKTVNLSATRTYPGLSDADVFVIPKTVTDNGNTLTLADVQWSNDGTWYTATAKYSGATTSCYATGYTVTADYTGEVAKADCGVMVYTAVFGSVKLPKESAAPNTPEESANPGNTSAASVNWAGLKIPLLIGGIILIVAIGGVVVFKKSRR